MRRTNFSPMGWHVMARGARRLDLFRDDKDFREFLRILGYALEVSGAVLWAFALMSNHYHLVVYASTKQLTDCMRRLNRMYSTYHNNRYGLTGHAFDGPYRAYPQGSKRLLLRCIAYVLRNPVVAGITDRAEDYAWSSARDFFGLEGSCFPVNPAQVMRYVHRDLSVAWEWFHQAMEREGRKPKRKGGTGISRLEIQSLQFEWLLEHAQDQESVEGLDPREVAVYWARQCGISPKAIAKVLKYRRPKEITRIFNRISKEIQEDPALASKLARP